MVKGTLLTIIIIASSLSLHAQKNFLPGYVILNGGDTLKGLVNYKTSKEISEQCEFRENKNGTTISYSSSQALGYGFSGDKQFVSKEVPVDSNKMTKVFLEVLVKGKVSLYRYLNDFLVEKDRLYPLEIETNTLNSQVVEDGLKNTGANINYEQKKKKYIGILNYLFIDCQGLSEDVSKVGLNERDLVSITKKYNKCVGANYTVTKEETKGNKVNFFISGGVSTTFLSFSADYYSFIASGEASMKSTTPFLSVGLQANNPLGSENVSATVEVQYSNETFHGNDKTVKSTYTYYDDYTLRYTRIKLPIGIKYNFSSGRLTPYFRFGACFNFFINGNIKATQIKEINYDGSSSEYHSDEDLTSLHLFQFWGSAGLQMKVGKAKTFLELRGDAIGGGANNGVYLSGPQGRQLVIDPKSVKTQSVNLIIGFIF